MRARETALVTCSYTKDKHEERGVQLPTPPTTTSSHMFQPPSSLLSSQDTHRAVLARIRGLQTKLYLQKCVYVLERRGIPLPLILAPEVHPRAGRGLTQVDRPVLPPSTHCFISLQVIPSIHLIGHPTRGDTSPFTLPRPRRRPFKSAQGTAST